MQYFAWVRTRGYLTWWQNGIELYVKKVRSCTNGVNTSPAYEHEVPASKHEAAPAQKKAVSVSEKPYLNPKRRHLHPKTRYPASKRRHLQEEKRHFARKNEVACIQKLGNITGIFNSGSTAFKTRADRLKKRYLVSNWKRTASRKTRRNYGYIPASENEVEVPISELLRHDVGSAGDTQQLHYSATATTTASTKVVIMHTHTMTCCFLRTAGVIHQSLCYPRFLSPTYVGATGVDS